MKGSVASAVPGAGAVIAGAALAVIALAAVAAPPAHARQAAAEAQRTSTTSHCNDLTPSHGATLLPSRDLYCLFFTVKPK